MSIRSTRQFVDVVQLPVGDARVSRQYVEVLRETVPGDARVSRQFIEILTPYTTEIEVEVDDTLSITDEVATWLEIISIEDPMSITDDVVCSKDIYVEIVDELDMESIGSKAEYSNVTSELNLYTDTLYIQLIGDFQPMSHDLNLQEDIEWENGLYLAPTHTLVLSQTVSYLLPIRASRHDVLHIEQELTFNWDSKLIEIEDELELDQTPSRTIEVDIEDELDLDSSVPTRVDTIISMVDSVTYGKQVDVSHSLGLTQTVTKTATFIRDASSAISMSDRFTYRPNLTPCDLKRYSPYYGSSSEGVKLPNRYPGGNRGDQTTFILADDPTVCITLKQPRFDDQIRISRDRVKQPLLTGDLKVFSDPSWPILNTLTFTLPTITTEKANEFLSFVQENLGRKMYLIDWYGRNWSGIIINPDSVITENHNSAWGINVEFRGKLDNTTPFKDTLDIQDFVEVEIV